MKKTRAEQLLDLGQSVWLDYIRRGQLRSGEFDQLVRLGVVGVTSNPTIFQLSISQSQDYDQAIQSGANRGLEGVALFENLAIEDIQDACDRLRPIWERTGGRDGRVSIEVNPHLAHDTPGTIDEARRLHRQVARDNVMVKVPAGTTKDQVNITWQNLLSERFGVKIHHEPKEFQVEDLEIGKGGSKLKGTTLDPDAPLPAGPPQRDKNGELSSPGVVATIMPGASGPNAHATAKAQPLSRLAAMLTTQINRPVLDKTGLTGLYDFKIDYSIDLSAFPLPPGGTAPPTGASDPGPDLSAAVEQQLGLKLVSSKANLDVIVIDQAEKVPTEN